MRPKREISRRALVFNPPLGDRPELLWIKLGSLNIDESYQRTLEAETSISLIRYIAGNWDWRLCQPLSVARREDKSLWIVDGQHRHAAACLRDDIPGLPCVVQVYNEVAHEAAAFVDLNKQRRPLNAVDLFKAALAAGKEEEAGIMSLLEEAGLSLAKHQNYFAWQPGQVFCIPTIRSAYRRYGPNIVRRGLKTYAKAFEGQILQNAGVLLRALFVFYAQKSLDPEFDGLKFAHRFGLNSQSDWMLKIRRAMVRQELGQGVAAVSVLFEAYKQAMSDGG